MRNSHPQRFTFSGPVLTPELLASILAGQASVDPAIERALATASDSGQDPLCPWCNHGNDRVIRIKSCGMGVESVAHLLEVLMTPQSRDYCLCQLQVITMMTGDEWRDTIRNMERYVLPLYRYFRIRFVELARGGPRDEDGIVILQDTRRPERLHPEGYYKLSEHLLVNGTVPQVGSSRLCSVKFKGWVGDYWLNNCLGLDFCHHLFGFNAGESVRARDCRIAIRAQNESARAKAGSQSRARRTAAAAPPPRVRLRTSGTRPEDYQLIDLRFEHSFQSDTDAAATTPLTSYLIFGYSSGEMDRARDAARFDKVPRATLCGEVDREAGQVVVRARRPLRRIAVFPLIEWGWPRLKCLLSIYLRLGVKWEKSCCGECPFDKEGSKCTAKGIARRQRDPETTAQTLLIEYGSLCLNERGLLYARKSFRAVVIDSQLEEGMRLFEERLAAIDFSLFEVKRIYTQKGKAARSVIRLRTGTRAEMTRAFTEETARLRLTERELHGITYGLFAERGAEYPALEGFLVVAPAYINEKVRGDFLAFEQRFAGVAETRGLVLPDLPGTHRVQERAGQPSLFAVAHGRAERGRANGGASNLEEAG